MHQCGDRAVYKLGQPPRLKLCEFQQRLVGSCRRNRKSCSMSGEVSETIWACCASSLSDSFTSGMAKRTAQKREDRSDSALRQEDSIFSSRERKRDACAAATFERPDLLILLGLAIVTFGIYAQLIGHRFITLDDPTYIQDNPMVNRGVTLAGLAWAFTTFYAGNWHPLTWIAHLIHSQLFGMIAGGHLLVNALIHAANTLLVFRFLFRTTRARWSSALVAALFALHPLHVQSVAWAAERKDTLSTFFGLLSLISYTRYAEENSRKWYAWTVLTLVLGLLAKPVLVTWPFVMLLLDYWPLRRLAQSTSRKNFLVSIAPLLRAESPALGI